MICKTLILVKMPDSRIIQGMEWLDTEIKKDQKEIDDQKNKMIKEIRSINRSQMFPEKKKISFFKKLLIVIGYGKRG